MMCNVQCARIKYHKRKISFRIDERENKTWKKYWEEEERFIRNTKKKSKCEKQKIVCEEKRGKNTHKIWRISKSKRCHIKINLFFLDRLLLTPPKIVSMYYKVSKHFFPRVLSRNGLMKFLSSLSLSMKRKQTTYVFDGVWENVTELCSFMRKYSNPVKCNQLPVTNRQQISISKISTQTMC